jgi:hypothetical protein
VGTVEEVEKGAGKRKEEEEAEKKEEEKEEEKEEAACPKSCGIVLSKSERCCWRPSKRLLHVELLLGPLVCSRPMSTSFAWSRTF